MENQKSLSRREMFTKMLCAVPVGLLVLSTIKSIANAAVKFASPSGALEKGLKYVEDTSKMNPPPADKMGVKGKEQKCSNCQMYTKQGDEKGKEYGKCLLIPTGSVYAKGWCTSWVKKVG